MRNGIEGASRGKKPEVVVITGASAGVGRATARYFGERGARVALIARGMEGLRAAHDEIVEAGGSAMIMQADVADPEMVENAAAQIEEAMGPIDIWINNAMASVLAPFKEVEVADFRRVTEVTYLGTVYGTKAALKRMLPRNRGTIVQVGSALAHRSIPLQSAYCGAKHAIKGFTDSLRSELIHDGSKVQLTMVQLPAINTPQFSWVRSRLPKKAQPVPPIFQPEVAAEAIHYAAHHPRREMLVGMSTIKAVMGQKFIPGLLDHYLARAAYDGQQTDQRRNPRRRDNLYQPIAQDRGARGDFDEEAVDSSPALWVSERRNTLALCAAGLAAGAGLAYSLSRRH
jgi:NADP-dependent 3-hydroxy acid dehydrogenase YdfG